VQSLNQLIHFTSNFTFLEGSTTGVALEPETMDEQNRKVGRTFEKFETLKASAKTWKNKKKTERHALAFPFPLARVRELFILVWVTDILIYGVFLMVILCHSKLNSTSENVETFH
jgi:hypothetical protein